MRNRKGESPMENTNVLFDRKRLVRLIVPLIVEQVLAVTVGMADMVMVSGAGETAVSGISLVNTICVLLIVIFTSMASGGSVVGAQFLGSGDKKTACHAAEQLVMICGLIALVICGISFFGNRWILRVVYGSVEEQVMAYAVEYFFITSLSFPFLGIYNAGAALFRVMGNSNISMVTSIVMNALNIIGNAVFVFGFGMGVAGVALSTLISRAFASVVILVLLHQEKYEIHCTKWFLAGWDKEMLKKIFSIGVPQALENSMFQIGKLLTQSMIAGFGTASIAANACAMTVEQLAFMPGSAMGLVVNGFGFLFVAGFTASNKLYGVLEMAAVSYGYAITTYVGQNLGAKKYQRIRKGVHSGTYMALLTSVMISGVMVLFGRNILSLFVSGEPEQIRQVLDIAYQYLFIMAIFLWVLYLLYVYRSAIQGLGNTLIPLASGIAEFVMRVSVALLLPKLIGEDGIFYAEICAWTSAAVLLFISYMIIIRKYKDSSELPAKGL